MSATLTYLFNRLGLGSNGKIATLVALLGLGSAAIWFYRDARDVVQDFGAAEGSRCVNINTADIATLETLPGVGGALAHRIVIGRPYAKIDDLLRVSGIGERSLDGFRTFVVVAGETRKRKDGESC